MSATRATPTRAAIRSRRPPLKFSCSPRWIAGSARFWYNGAAIDNGAQADAGSRFDATISGASSDYYLRTDFTNLFLSTAAGSSRTFIDELLDSSVPCPDRPFTAFGTWGIVP